MKKCKPILKNLDKISFITRSAKSHPGDGTHGNGQKGDKKRFEALFA